MDVGVSGLNRQQIFDYAKEKYGAEPEYQWLSYPTYAVLRHRENEKWYAIVMDVTKNKLGLDGSEPVDVLNVKLEPMLVDFLRQTDGFVSAYHMNKTHWLGILLDGTVPDEQILDLLDQSYQLTAKKVRRKVCSTNVESQF